MFVRHWEQRQIARLEAELATMKAAHEAKEDEIRERLYRMRVALREVTGASSR